MRTIPVRPVASAAGILALALSAPAAGDRIEVPLQEGILGRMSVTMETLRSGVLSTPGRGTARDLEHREAARALLAEAYDTVRTGDVPAAAALNLRAAHHVDWVLREARGAGDPQAVEDLEYWIGCVVDNYVGRVSFAATHLRIASEGEDPLAGEWADASDRTFPILLRAVQVFFPPEGDDRIPTMVRAYRHVCRAARIAARWCDWVVVPDPPPPPPE